MVGREVVSTIITCLADHGRRIHLDRLEIEDLRYSTRIDNDKGNFALSELVRFLNNRSNTVQVLQISYHFYHWPRQLLKDILSLPINALKFTWIGLLPDYDELIVALNETETRRTSLKELRLPVVQEGALLRLLGALESRDIKSHLLIDDSLGVSAELLQRLLSFRNVHKITQSVHAHRIYLLEPTVEVMRLHGNIRSLCIHCYYYPVDRAEATATPLFTPLSLGSRIACRRR